MKKVVDIRAARKAAQKRKYSALVLDTFDRMEHESNRQQREQTAQVRRNARNKL
jgi:hypothetical protein